MSSESQKEKKESGAEKVPVELMAENSPNLTKEINLHIQESE